MPRPSQRKPSSLAKQREADRRGDASMKFVVEIPAEQEQAFKQAVKDCNGSCFIGDQDLVYEAIPEPQSP